MLLEKNMPSNLLVACLVVIGLVLGVCSTGNADKLQEYSAQQVLVRKGVETPTGAIFVSPNKWRIEHAGMGDRPEMIIIFRQDKKVSWTLLPDKKKYMESVLSEEDLKKQINTPGGMGLKGFSMKEEKLGTETINGYKCDKKRIETTMQMMGHPITSHSTVWISDKFDLPLRTENQDGTVTEMRNIKPGSQDSSLFEVPAGYSKTTSLMGEMMEEGEAEAPRKPRKPPPGSGSQAGTPPQMPENMPEDIRKMIEQQMGQPPGD